MVQRDPIKLYLKNRKTTGQEVLDILYVTSISDVISFNAAIWFLLQILIGDWYRKKSFFNWSSTFRNGYRGLPVFSHLFTFDLRQRRWQRNKDSYVYSWKKERINPFSRKFDVSQTRIFGGRQNGLWKEKCAQKKRQKCKRSVHKQ